MKKFHITYKKTRKFYITDSEKETIINFQKLSYPAIYKLDHTDNILFIETVDFDVCNWLLKGKSINNIQYVETLKEYKRYLSQLQLDSFDEYGLMHYDLVTRIMELFKKYYNYLETYYMKNYEFTDKSIINRINGICTITDLENILIISSLTSDTMLSAFPSAELQEEHGDNKVYSLTGTVFDIDHPSYIRFYFDAKGIVRVTVTPALGGSGSDRRNAKRLYRAYNRALIKRYGRRRGNMLGSVKKWILGEMTIKLYKSAGSDAEPVLEMTYDGLTTA